MKTWLLRFTLILSSLAFFSFTKHPASKRTKSSMAAVSRTLVFPVKGSNSRIRDTWGASRGGGIRRHKGIDIHARKGTPVVAVSDGVIVEKAHMPIGGKTLWLKTDRYGWKAYYAHLDKQLVKEGQHVKKGQVIGTIGNTGNARTTPSHLHFGIAGSNGWVNPLPYVRNSPKMAGSGSKKTTKKRTSAAKKRK